MENEKEENSIGQGSGNINLQKPISVYPMTDAHMHIQSDDIAPIPIMVGVLKTNIIKMAGAGDLKNDGLMNYENLSFLAGEEISTKQKDFKLSDPNYRPKKGEKLLGKVANGLTKAESILGLERIGMTRVLNWFGSAIVGDYGKVCRQNSYLISGIYMKDADLKSTELGVNVCYEAKPFSEDKTVVNPRKVEKARAEGEKCQKNIINSRAPINNHLKEMMNGYYRYKDGTSNSSLLADFSFCLCMGMELMYAHYWGVYGIPIYILDRNEVYMFTYHYCHRSKRLSGTDNSTEDVMDLDLENAYDIRQSDFDKDWSKEYARKIDKSPIPTNQISSRAPYKHFLKKTTVKELVQFEPHENHVEYQKMAAVRYPFSFLPFYHVDARRFFSPLGDGTYDLSNHKFYVQTPEYHYRVLDTDKIKTKLTGSDNHFQYQQSVNELKKEFLQADKGGVFWGVKLYVALGYPPWIGVDDLGQKVFSKLPSGAYKGFVDFLSWCGEMHIPITCHGSPQGMTIADPQVYFKEYLKKNDSYYTSESADFKVDVRGYMNGLGLIDDFSSPYSWEIVLAKVEKPMKICIAHFGGMGFFNGSLRQDDNSPYMWQVELSTLINSEIKHQVFTDLSCYTFKYPEFPYDLSERDYNCLKNSLGNDFDLGKFYVAYKPKKKIIRYKKNFDEKKEERKEIIKLRFAMLRVGVIGNEREKDKVNNGEKDFDQQIYKTAKRLTELIVKFPKLKNRIMFGTDYPMTEMSIKGVPDYSCGLFVLLQLVTAMLGGEGQKWDAWHQFTVLNPLKFFGVLADDSGKSYDEAGNSFNEESEYFTINTKYFKMMKINLQNEFKKVDDSGKWGFDLFAADGYENILEDTLKAKGLENPDGTSLKIPASNLITEDGKKESNLLISEGLEEKIE